MEIQREHPGSHGYVLASEPVPLDSLLSVAQWALANHSDAVGAALDVSDDALDAWKVALDQYLN